jgi:phosphomethylpyrimidine synthase
MKITQDVRRYAEERGVSAETALAVGMQEKAQQFRAHGDRVYLPRTD